jgi:two-component system, LytTR family, sensor kinase
VDGQRERRQLQEPPRHRNEVSHSSASDSAPSAGPRWTRRLRLAFWALLLWTGLSVFFASQFIILSGGKIPWGVALSLTAPRWYVWGLLTPLIFWIDRRLGASRSLAARVALHVPLGLAVTCLSIVIRLISRPLRGARWPPSIAEFFLERFYWDLLIYAVIAGVSIARDYAAQVRQRDREAHELALQTADLERRLVEARLQSLRAQLHPHFLFNALNTISAFTETNPQMARRLMERLGDLLRASLTHASRPRVTLGEELTFLDDYLVIESARFEGRIVVTVDVDDDLLDVMVPSFLLQPLVENAIRHGVGARLSGGHVEVTARREDSVLKLRVRDDGVGLKPGWQMGQNGGVGLLNVASRLEHLYSRSDLLRVAPVPSGGVEVHLDLPVRAGAAVSATPAAAASRSA